MNSYDSFLSPLGRNLHESVLRKMGQVIASRSGDLISFAAGYPDPAGDTRGIKADLSEVMTTSGSQQGLDLTARVLIAPGDVVLVEVPTYTGAIAAFRNAQCRLVGVRQDADGINLEDLDAVCMRERAAGSRVNLLYLVPNFQNPAGILLSLEKRQRLLEWAERRNLLIIEDDPYGELYFEDVATAAETRPLKAGDRHGRVIYLSTFSKTLAPGFRVAWVAAPAPIVERFDTAKRDGTDAARSVWRSHLVDQAEGRLLPLGTAAGGFPGRGAAREGDGAGGHLRHRQRVLRRRQRPRPRPAVVLVADARSHPRGRDASRESDDTDSRRAYVIFF